MDIIFNCSKCDVELAVDASGAGSEINCPECGELITIPAESTVVQPPAPPLAPPIPAPPGAPPGSGAINAMAVSAAAKVEHHFSVPVSNKPVTQLVARQTKTTDAPVKGGAIRVRVKTIRHSDCVEVGHDRFDDIVSEFIGKVGDTNVVSMTPITYSHTEHGGDRLVMDYGLVIVYKG